MSDLQYIRDSKKPIYVSTEVWRALWFRAKAAESTPDEIADVILRNAINETHPEILEHLKREDKATKDLITALQKK